MIKEDFVPLGLCQGKYTALYLLKIPPLTPAPQLLKEKLLINMN